MSHRCALQRTCGLDHAPRALHRKRAVSPDQKQDYPSLVPCLVARSSHFWDAETKLGDYSIPAGDRRAPAHGGRAARPTMRVLRWDRGGRKRSMTPRTTPDWSMKKHVWPVVPGLSSRSTCLRRVPHQRVRHHAPKPRHLRLAAPNLSESSDNRRPSTNK